MEHLPGYPVCLFRGEKDCGIGDIFGLSNSSQRITGRDFLFQLGRHPACLNSAGRDDIDGYSVRPQFMSSGSAVAFHSEFTGSVGDIGRMGICAVSADVDDPSPGGFSDDVSLSKLFDQKGNSACVYGKMFVMRIRSYCFHRIFTHKQRIFL